jgi:hypothetical protein
MYCSTCGQAVTPGLSYCSRCGNELNAKGRNAAKSSELPPVSLVWGIVAVTIFGLALTIGLLAVMKGFGFNEGVALAFAGLSLLFILIADSAFLWLLLRPKRHLKELMDTAKVKPITTNELGEQQAQALPEPAMSVTDHTTRTLEPMREKRNAE